MWVAQAKLWRTAACVAPKSEEVNEGTINFSKLCADTSHHGQGLPRSSHSNGQTTAASCPCLPQHAISELRPGGPALRNVGSDNFRQKRNSKKSAHLDSDMGPAVRFLHSVGRIIGRRRNRQAKSAVASLIIIIGNMSRDEVGPASPHHSTWRAGPKRAVNVLAAVA